MTILDDPPATLITSTIKNFSISGDLASLTRITSHRLAIHKARCALLEQSSADIATMKRKLDLARTSTSAARSDQAKENYDTNMMNFEREKFSLAKTIRDLESSTHNLEGQVARLKEELEQVESEDVNDAPAVVSQDDILLRLKVYRNLGIELVQEEGSACGVPGEVKTVIVRNPREEDFRMVNIDKKFSTHFYVNLLWGYL